MLKFGNLHLILLLRERSNPKLVVMVDILIICLCDPTVAIWCLIWRCDMAVHIIHLIAHGFSLCCHTLIEENFNLGVY